MFYFFSGKHPYTVIFGKVNILHNKIMWIWLCFFPILFFQTYKFQYIATRFVFLMEHCTLLLDPEWPVQLNALSEGLSTAEQEQQLTLSVSGQDFSYRTQPVEEQLYNTSLFQPCTTVPVPFLKNKEPSLYYFKGLTILLLPLQHINRFATILPVGYTQCIKTKSAVSWTATHIFQQTL